MRTDDILRRDKKAAEISAAFLFGNLKILPDYRPYRLFFRQGLCYSFTEIDSSFSCSGATFDGESIMVSRPELFFGNAM